MPSANSICHFDGGRSARRNNCWSDASCAIEGLPGGFFSKNYLVLTRVESVGQAVLLAWISEGANKSWCSPTGARPVRVRP